ncbi:MAG: ribosome-recycling factor [bacterium]|nr:ribosome-recycling factor [bacterium]
MVYQDILKKVTPEIDLIVSNFKQEVNQMRTGRADPSLITDMKVNYLGQEFSLKQLAMISAVSPKEIIIQPWDVSYIEPILAVLAKTSVGSGALAEKNLIKVSLPPLTEEYRKNFIKLLSEKMEAQRVSIRKIRDRVWKEIQDGEKEGLIREDDKFRGKEELDKLVKKCNDQIEEMGEKKKKEIME